MSVTPSTSPEYPSAKFDRLRNVIAEMQSVLVAYSGGIDSALVLKVAYEELGEHVLAITALSPTFPAEELENAQRVAQEIGARHEFVQTDQLAVPEFVRNDAMRCFHCKTDLYQLLEGMRLSRSFQWVADGTNLDDLGDDRPGIKAARELKVRSPLAECSFSKADVRAVARRLGLSCWDKPAAACLSSRIPRGIPITFEKLRRVEQAEAILHAEGFVHIRVRDHGDIARLEMERGEFTRLDDQELRARLSSHLRKLGFRFVCVDLEGYRAGGVSLG